jgi:hypothetical protein
MYSIFMYRCFGILTEGLTLTFYVSSRRVEQGRSFKSERFLRKTKRFCLVLIVFNIYRSYYLDFRTIIRFIKFLTVIVRFFFLSIANKCYSGMKPFALRKNTEI